MLNDELSVGGIRERLLLIKAMPTLATLDDEGCAMIAAHTIERVFSPGEVVLRENEPVHSGFMVIDGMIEVSRGGYVTARVDRGGVGFLSLLAHDPSGVHAVATKRTLALQLPVEALFEAYEENFSFMKNALRLCALGMLEKRDNLPRRADEGSEPPLGGWYERPRTLVERMIVATQRPTILSDMNVDAVIDWARIAKEVRVEPGHVFWKIGDPGTFSISVEYGRVRCTSAEERSVVVGHQYVLGALDPICQRPRAYRAEAETKVIGVMIESDDWMQVIEHHRRLGMNLLKALATQLLSLQLDEAKRKATSSAA